MRVWKSTTYNQKKKCHGDDIKESTRNHKFVQHTPLRSHLLTIPTIHLRENCKKSQKRLPHRICKQDQAGINIQHSKLKTEKKRLPENKIPSPQPRKSAYLQRISPTKWPQPHKSNKGKERDIPQSCSLAKQKDSSTYTPCGDDQFLSPIKASSPSNQ
jgi:hypothetical protein